MKNPLGRIVRVGLGQTVGVFLVGNFLPVLEVERNSQKCIIIEEPIKDITLVQIDEEIDCKIKPSFKLSIYKTLGYASLDICLDIDIELLKQLKHSFIKILEPSCGSCEFIHPIKETFNNASITAIGTAR